MGILDNSVAMVTGAASGIGEASARLLAARGAHVWLTDINLAEAERIASELNALGLKATAARLDVADKDATDALFANVEQNSGRLDIAVLNAGLAIGSRIYDGDVDVFDKHVAIMLRGVFLGMRKAGPLMHKSGGGSIVVISSTAGLMAQGMPGYCAAKHGAVGLSKIAAVEFSQYNIRVNAVCPGFTNTRILGPGFDNPDLQNLAMRGHALMNRVADPSEIAECVAFLAGPQSKFITGVAIPVDGGMIVSPDTPHEINMKAFEDMLTGL